MKCDRKEAITVSTRLGTFLQKTQNLYNKAQLLNYNLLFSHFPQFVSQFFFLLPVSFSPQSHHKSPFIFQTNKKVKLCIT